jgi:hypothetical protein
MSNCHPDRRSGSTGNGFEQSIHKFPWRSSEHPGSAESRPPTSNPAEASRCEPTLRHRSKHFHSRQLPASSAWPLAGRFRGTCFARQGHGHRETRCGGPRQIVAHARRWPGKGCTLHRKEPQVPSRVVPPHPYLLDSGANVHGIPLPIHPRIARKTQLIAIS